MGFPEGEESHKVETLSEEIIDENFPSLVKNMDINIFPESKNLKNNFNFLKKLQ